MIMMVIMQVELLLQILPQVQPCPLRAYLELRTTCRAWRDAILLSSFCSPLSVCHSWDWLTHRTLLHSLRELELRDCKAPILLVDCLPSLLSLKLELRGSVELLKVHVETLEDLELQYCPSTCLQIPSYARLRRLWLKTTARRTSLRVRVWVMPSFPELRLLHLTLGCPILPIQDDLPDLPRLEEIELQFLTRTRTSLGAGHLTSVRKVTIICPIDYEPSTLGLLHLPKAEHVIVTGSSVLAAAFLGSALAGKCFLTLPAFADTWQGKQEAAACARHASAYFHSVAMLPQAQFCMDRAYWRGPWESLPTVQLQAAAQACVPFDIAWGSFQEVHPFVPTDSVTITGASMCRRAPPHPCEGGLHGRLANLGPATQSACCLDFTLLYQSVAT